MTSCPRATRRYARDTGKELETCEDVLRALVLDPNQGEYSEWTLEVTLDGDRLPSDALQILADRAGAILSITPRAPGTMRAIVAL